MELAARCSYLKSAEVQELDKLYDNIIGKLVRMASKPEDWIIR